MLAQKSLIFLMILTPWLASCDDEKVKAAVDVVSAQPSKAARKAEILRQLSPLCADPLSNEDLERAAQFVETHKDQGSLWMAKKITRMDAEARICRNQQ